ncbi:hypothetical protein [Hymenobacter koreensis]|uniref:Uncharacterized protein n=1 Tax=Hymenobacter koreensis TaxID=1084523 RepID=A0ABP8JH75_9BACT
MPKLLLLLLLAALAFLDPAAALAAPASSAATSTELALESTVGIPRPRYKKYRGNSRRKYRRNIFRRAAAKRQAKQKTQAAPRRRGVITVEPPVRN